MSAARGAPSPPLSEPVFQILLSLSDASMHGYAVIQDVRERTSGTVDLTASTLYAALKRLLHDGWIGERSAAGGDSRRRTYEITRAGRKVLRLEAQRLAAAAEMARARGLLAGATDPGAR